MIKQEFNWQDFKISDNDITNIFNHLLETETPATHLELAQMVILNEIDILQKSVEAEQKNEGAVYYPKDIYKISNRLLFPHLSWKKGTVVNVRNGENPEIPDLQVIDVEFEDSSHMSFASNLASHKLNAPVQREVAPWMDSEKVISQFGADIAFKIKDQLDNNPDLVRIAGHYFPRALLENIGIGQLNLCEAILEIENGGPLSTQELLKQIDISSSVNSKLIDFSLEYALQEDTRFDEVGPAGKTLWFLNRLEPAEVQNTPLHLRFTEDILVLSAELAKYKSFGAEQCDEFESENSDFSAESVTLSLIYPHWRSGTLPLTPKLINLFPTSYETPRIQFNFVDSKNNSTFSGWVVRHSKYIFGLKDWYSREGVIPGSLIQVSRGMIPGEVNIKVEKAKNSKEWIRTILVGADGGIVFALLKQVVTCAFDDRMALVTPSIDALDLVWDKKLKIPMEKIVHQTMQDLSKLNPQGQIHAQELYAAVNAIRRCPPSTILDLLFTQPWVKHLGDLYFKLTD